MTKSQILAAWQRHEQAARKPRYGCARRERARLRAFVHSLLASDVGAQQTLMWVPVGLGVPEGWHLARQQTSHHSFWSQLVQRDA